MDSAKKEEEDPHPVFHYHAVNLRNLNENKVLEELTEEGGVEGVAAHLGTDLKAGLPTNDPNAAERVEVFGVNVNPEPPHDSLLKLYLTALKDPTLIILNVAALISLVLGLTVDEDKATGWIEGAAILFAVQLVAWVTAFNDFGKERQFRNLNKVKENRRVKIIRSGEEREISIFELVVGELVILDTGDQVPADGLFVSGYNLQTDESVMTGETDAVKKNENKPFMLSGCQVTEGVGQMLVTAVGPWSEWGITLGKLQEESEDTPLQKKLNFMAAQIGKIGLFMAVITVSALFISFCVQVFLLSDCDDKIIAAGSPFVLCAPPDFQLSWISEWVHFFIIGVTIVVVAVPEGLPLAVTISLAYSMKKMMKDNNLVRHLSACETMGGATQICSDKTGTLTQNRMTVMKGYLAGIFYESVPAASDLATNVVNLINVGIAVNSKAFISLNEVGLLDFVGNKTECALLVFCQKLGGDYREIRSASVVKQLYAFSSARKRMSVIVAQPDNKPKPFRIYTKGASEMVLQLCTHVLNTAGEVVSLDEVTRQQMAEGIQSMASEGLRTIGLAYKDLAKEEASWETDAPDEGLICVGIVGIKDPVRPEVPPAVRQCMEAGIVVRMVTGDNISTAMKIAQECGILTDGIAMEGPKFRQLSPEAMDRIIPKLQVLARSSPSDKYLLVQRLKRMGEVVAVTGDGTNDAPALKEADVGLSMGLAGTEVAKEASDIVIMDDNFSSIVKAVMWGRCVYDNIRKFLQFQLTVNIVALSVAFIGAVTQRGTPLTAVQLLWVNLIMDTMAALALGTEGPTPELLQRKPYGRYDFLLSYIMMRNMLGQALYQLAVLLFLLYFGHLVFPISEGSREHYTIIFNAFVQCQIFNEINSRKINDEMNVFAGMATNPIFLSILVITFVLQWMFVEYGGAAVQTVPLDFNSWVGCVLIGVISLPIGFLLRLVPVPVESAQKFRTGLCGRRLKPSVEEGDAEMDDVDGEPAASSTTGAQDEQSDIPHSTTPPGTAND